VLADRAMCRNAWPERSVDAPTLTALLLAIGLIAATSGPTGAETLAGRNVGALCTEVERQGRHVGRGPYPDPRQDRGYATKLARRYELHAKVADAPARPTIVALQRYYEHLASLKKLAAHVSYSNQQLETLTSLQQTYLKIVDNDCVARQGSQVA
jgi:hypothetical protein